MIQGFFQAGNVIAGGMDDDSWPAKIKKYNQAVPSPVSTVRISLVIV